MATRPSFQRPPSDADQRVTRLLWWLGTSLLLVTLSSANAAPLSAAAQRGKQIYLTGSSVSGPTIMARLGAAEVTVPAAATPCASCHGKDGRGRAESGVTPSDIRWSQLSRDGDIQRSKGRTHPAYDATTLKRAIRSGIDAGGNPIDPTMPRFSMGETDLDDLLTYLQVLERDRDPGIDEQRLRVATVIPAHGPMAASGEHYVAVLQAYFDEVNSAGGIFQRRLELDVQRANSPDDALARLEQLANGDVFALIGPYTAGIDQQAGQIAELRQLPIIAPFSLHSPAQEESARFTFYLLAGHRLQARALVDFAASRVPDPSLPLAIVQAGAGEHDPLGDAFLQQGIKWDWRNLYREQLAVGDLLAQQISTLRDARVSRVFFSGDAPALARFLQAADAGRWWPFVFALGNIAGGASLQAPTTFHRKLYLAYPTGISDVSPQGWEAFNRFLDRHALDRRQRITQFSAYVSAQILVDALKQVGRELSRDGLISQLEQLYRYQTGLLPPLTYGANRRVGAYGAHVVAADLEHHTLARESTWIEPH